MGAARKIEAAPPEPVHQPCAVCSAWGSYGLGPPAQYPHTTFWCRDHLPETYWQEKRHVAR